MLWVEMAPSHVPETDAVKKSTARRFAPKVPARRRLSVATDAEPSRAQWPNACGRSPSLVQDMPASMAALPDAAKAAICPGATDLDALRSPECFARAIRWRNDATARVMRAAKVPIAPLFDALEPRGDLHEQDCGHWCEGSEATAFMALSLLNTLRAMVA